MTKHRVDIESIFEAVPEDASPTITQDSVSDILRTTQQSKQAGFATEVFGVVVAPGKEYSPAEKQALAEYVPENESIRQAWTAFLDSPSESSYTDWQSSLLSLYSDVQYTPDGRPIGQVVTESPRVVTVGDVSTANNDVARLLGL